jgi:hypothetical protein
MSPAMVAAAAVTGEVTDPRRFVDAARTVSATDVEVAE